MPSLLQSETPRLPWEVIERIIGHSGDDSRTLRTLSLLCRELRPRALCLMVAGIRLRSRDQTFGFCDLLRDKPQLRPLVGSIVVDLMDFSPVPILRILPNVREIMLTSRIRRPVRALHQSSLTCFQLLGSHIHTLHLSHLSFDTDLQFARVLLAFTGVVHLTFTNTEIKKAGNPGHITLLRQRLSKQLALRLKTLVIDTASVPGRRVYGKTFMEELFFDSDVVLSTVQSLKLVGVEWPEVPAWDNADSVAWSGLQTLLLKGPDWSRLRSLALRISYLPHFVPDTLKFLEAFQSTALKEVSLELVAAVSVTVLIRPLLSHGAIGASELEDDRRLQRPLLRFPSFRIVWIMEKLRANRLSFWNGLLGMQFPLLHQRGRLTVEAKEVLPFGHDTCICALVISPNCMWVASGSEDFTIILWDDNGNVARQWIAHGYTPVRSLAFSRDSRYLLSGGEDRKMVLWDLGQLEGTHEPPGTTFNLEADVQTMAWSPTSDVIAFGFWDGTVQLWDAHTFRQLNVLLDVQDKVQNVVARCLTFSPDGHWLAFGIPPCNYCICDVQSGTLHHYVRGPVPRFWSTTGPACSTGVAFDPTSTRLASLSGADVEIWDIEMKSSLSHLRYPSSANDVSFSPDGKLVLVALTDTTVSCSNAHTGEQIFLLRGHTGQVMKARFSPCGRYIATASWDRTVRLWKMSNGSQVAKYTVSEGDEWVDLFLTFSPDGKTLVSGGMDGRVAIRRMDDIIPEYENCL